MEKVIYPTTLVLATLVLGCGGAQPAPDAPVDDATEEPRAITDPGPPAGEPPALEAAPIGVGDRIEVEYEFGAWGPCKKQRVVYSKQGSDHTYTRFCDDDGSMSAEGITEDQFRQAVFIEDHLPAVGRPMEELPADSHPERCPDCTKCFRSPDGVLTTCQNGSGVVTYMYSNPAALGRTDANTTRTLISYEEQ